MAAPVPAVPAAPPTRAQLAAAMIDLAVAMEAALATSPIPNSYALLRIAAALKLLGD